MRRGSPICGTAAPGGAGGRKTALRKTALCGLLWAAWLCSAKLGAQVPVDESLRLNASDLAVMEAHEVRKDINCTVTPGKPELGFDLRFHLGYDVSVPLSELSGAENQLTILFRVTPDLHKDQPSTKEPAARTTEPLSRSDGAGSAPPSYFVQHIHVPLIDNDAKGDADLHGGVDLGEGSYHVDWLMRDRQERVCAFFWDSDAVLQPKDKQIQVALAPGTAEAPLREQFTEARPVERTPGPLNIKVLVNFAPQLFDAAAMRPRDTVALVTMLRRISQEPHFGKFSVVAFSIQEQRVLYRQTSSEKIDFPALGQAVRGIKLGVVDAKQLAHKHGDVEFLTGLIKQEISGPDHPDALIFAGPKMMLDDSVPDDQLRAFAGDVDFPVFYLNYNLYPLDMPWKDSVSHAVKLFRGTEYTISRPRDLWFAVTDLVSRIVKSKHGRSTNPVSSQ